MKLFIIGYAGRKRPYLNWCPVSVSKCDPEVGVFITGEAFAIPFGREHNSTAPLPVI